MSDLIHSIFEYANKLPSKFFLPFSVVFCTAGYYIVSSNYEDNFRDERYKHHLEVDGYKSRIETLESNLSLIKRSLPNSEKERIFDLNSILVNRHDLARTRFDQWYGDWQFGFTNDDFLPWVELSTNLAIHKMFLNVPLLLDSTLDEKQDKNPPRTTLSNLESETSEYSKYLDDLGMSEVFENFRRIKVHTWSRDEIDVFFISQDMNNYSIYSTPSASIYIVDRKYYKNIIEVSRKMMEEFISKDFIKNYLGADNVKDLIERQINKMNNTFDTSDISSLHLTELLQYYIITKPTLSSLKGVSSKISISAIEKSGNITYISTATSYSNEKPDSKIGSVFMLNEEYFILDRGSDVFIVHISIPVTPNSSTDYATIQNWFHALRVAELTY